jgi:integrase
MHDVDDMCDDATPMKRAIWYRQALMIGLLISRPVRRRTFIGIRLGAHLSEVSDGFVLHFRPEDMKDKRHHSYPLPKALVVPMRRYLDIHRPVLLQDKSSDGLWINQYGNVITADGYARELPKITQKHLGIELRPHAFRHIAATSIAEVDPEHVGIIRDILGHASLDMAYKHYNRASQISSCNGLQSIVEDIRKNVPKMGRAKQRLSPPDIRSKS